MSLVKSSKETDYSRFVFYNVPSTIREGQGAYTISELAARVGLKPTQHFKRRVREMAAKGVLKAEAVFSPRGGLMAVYSMPENESSEVFPF